MADGLVRILPGDIVNKPNKPKARAPEQTFEEVKYLRHLIDDEVTVTVKMMDNEEVTGVIEYYDHNFIRVTRKGAPNLFIYKHEIKYLYEAGT
jgi:sRNA-binding regulator protein Hfq